jgi:hypothetical protein
MARYDEQVKYYSGAKFEQLKMAAFGEGTVALVFWEPNCDPGRFEVMLDAMKLQDLVIAACSLWKRHPR